MSNTRCGVCGWPLDESAEKGCVDGACSYRHDARGARYRIGIAHELATIPYPFRTVAEEQKYVGLKDALTQSLLEARRKGAAIKYVGWPTPRPENTCPMPQLNNAPKDST